MQGHTLPAHCMKTAPWYFNAYGCKLTIFFLFFYCMQLVASADCAGALDVTNDLRQLLVYKYISFT